MTLEEILVPGAKYTTEQLRAALEHEHADAEWPAALKRELWSRAISYAGNGFTPHIISVYSDLSDLMRLTFAAGRSNAILEQTNA